MKKLNEIPKSPLCVFCLSPPFSIRTFTRPLESSASRRLSVRNWRRGDSFHPSLRSRFKPYHRRSCNFLYKFIPGFVANKRKTLSFQEVLDEIQQAWKPEISDNSSCSDTMDENRTQLKKSAKDMFLPLLLRRRLSAPETIMRKHSLAQQRSDSQDTEIAQSETSMYQWNKTETGSDSNLNRKHDPDILRKTSLLRRFRSHSKPLTRSRWSGMFHEWQHFNAKLNSETTTHTTSSTHSTPEHGEFRISPIHYKKLSSTNKIYGLRKERSSNKKICSDSENTDKRTSSITTSLKTNTETETSPRYTTNTSYTTSSDNDSAYTNSKSNFSESLNNNSTTPPNSQEIVESRQTPSQNVDNSSVQLKQATTTHENTTQTVGTTNVNVISNVKLSPSTLNLIFNQVMNDVNESDTRQDNINKNVSVPNLVQVKECPSFYLNNNVEKAKQSHIIKCMLSNIGVGSLYTKPTEQSQMVVPRFSAKPQSASMEVNVSSGESTDKESDTLSLVDSLEDTSSLRTDPVWNEELNSKSDISLELPDNSNSKNNITNKSTAFFIPIEVEARNEFTPVSDYLPSKVRNKLATRQQNRERKIQNKCKQKSHKIGTSDGANRFNCNNNSVSDSDHNKLRKRHNKTVLPSIETLRRSNRREENIQKSPKDAAKSQTHRIFKTKTEKLSPLPKNDCVHNSRIYHKTERSSANKKIEILEIMECIDNSETLTQQFVKTKSKIPILTHNNKLTKLNSKTEKPAFLELDKLPASDPKLDQLIANILIETLNVPDVHESVVNENHDVKKHTCENQMSSKPHQKYQQKFEVIPEELQSGDTNPEPETKNNNNHVKDKSPYQGKTGLAVVTDGKVSTIPNGWITLYMLPNNRDSPESTSDEGKKPAKDNIISSNTECDVKATILENNMEIRTIQSDLTENVNYDNSANQCFNETNDQCSSSSDARTIKLPTNSNERRRKANNLRRGKHKVLNDSENIKQIGEWSVTVSGTNNYGQFAPNLEMNLKFAETCRPYYCPSQSDSGLGEDNEQKLHFPKIITKQTQCNKTPSDCENYAPQTLPDIPRCRTRRNQRRSESGISTMGNTTSRIEPRQTRTSTQRYKLSRPKLPYNKFDTPRSTIDLFNDKQYAEILRRFPEMLTINGNGINQEEK